MPRRSTYNEEDFDYDDDEYEDHKGPRKFKKEEKQYDKRRKWERESLYNDDHDYDERR